MTSEVASTDVPGALSAAWQHHQAGALAEAERIYRQIVAVEPAHADAWHLLGVAVYQQDRPAEAIELISRATALEPRNHAFLSHLGAAQGSAGQLDAAVLSFNRAIQLQPADAECWYNLAAALGQLGRLDEAIQAYRRALALQPNLGAAWFNLANALRDLRRENEAVDAYRQALRCRPDYADAHNNLGTLFHSQGNLPAALEALQQALRVKPDYQRAKSNLGAVLSDERRLDEAVALLQEVVAAEPGFAEAHNNLGVALMHRGELDQALAAVEHAVDLQPDYAEARKNRAIVRLFQGDFARGWPEFEWRWKSRDYPPNPFPGPYWTGEPLPDGTLLLHAEQGLGDAIQFVRFAAAAGRRAGRTVLVCQPQLVELFRQCADIEQVLPQGAALPRYDAQASLVSLPWLLSTSPSDIARDVPYLRPLAALAQRWHDELANFAGLKVGIVWQGNPQFRGDRFRSIVVQQFAPLALPGVTLLSLQKGAGSEQLATLGDRFPVVDLGRRLDQESGPFLDTAAVMTNLDLVITSDTAAAHLAGALGVPVWVALAHVPEWRWLLGREDSPWYPTMRLFRQPAPLDWPAVFRRMSAELQAQALTRAANRP